MPLSLAYRKGKELFEGGKIKLDVATEKALYFHVEGEHRTYEVRLMSDGTFNCTCALGSIKAGKGVLCSHVICSILFAVSSKSLVS